MIHESVCNFPRPPESADGRGGGRSTATTFKKWLMEEESSGPGLPLLLASASCQSACTAEAPPLPARRCWQPWLLLSCTKKRERERGKPSSLSFYLLRPRKKILSAMPEVKINLMILLLLLLMEFPTFVCVQEVASSHQIIKLCWSNERFQMSWHQLLI